MNPDILQVLALIAVALGIALGVAALVITRRRKLREREEQERLAEKARIQHAADKRRLLEQAEERDRKKKDIEQAEQLAKESSLRPVRALIEETQKQSKAPRVHNQRKNPPPAPKNTTSRSVNGRNETGYYDDSGFWVMLAINESITHQYYENLRNDSEAPARSEDPATPEPTPAPEYSKPDYSTPEYSKTEYSTPDYSSSSSNDSSSSSSSSYSSSSDSGSSYSSDSGSGGGGGGE